MRLSRSRGPRPRALVALAVLALAGAAQAVELSFGRAFDAALVYDAKYRAAAHELDATRLGEPIARSALLPSVSLSAATSSVVGTRNFPNALNQDVRIHVNYEAPQASLSLRMPILDFGALAGLELAEAQSAVAEQQLRADGLDLVDRLTGAWLQLLAAQETLSLQSEQLDLLTVRRSQAERRLAQGEGTRVQVAQTQASIEIARSRELEGQQQLALAAQGITRITGLIDVRIPGLPESVSFSEAIPYTMAGWIELAQRQSPMLQLRERVLLVARASVRRQYAGHLPRLDAVGSLSRQESDSTANIGQTTNLRSIGLQLTVPLFSGGGVDASVRQAVVRQMKADEELRLERENLVFDIQRFWLAAVGGQARVDALGETLRSQQLALKGAERALETGLGTAGEVADARSALIDVRRQLIEARLNQLQSHVRLQLRAGVPMSELVAYVDRLWQQAPTIGAGSGGKP